VLEIPTAFSAGFMMESGDRIFGRATLRSVIPARMAATPSPIHKTGSGSPMYEPDGTISFADAKSFAIGWSICEN
jgi:hypothetical protein